MPNQTENNKPCKPIGPLVAIFFGRIFPIPFIAIGILATIGGSKNLRYGLASESWPTAEATIVHTEIEQEYYPSTGSASGNYSYDITVRYAYTVDGAAYENDQITFPETLPNERSEAEKTVQRYPVSSTVPVAYNPKDPGESVLEPGTSFYSWLGPIFGLVFFFVGLIMAWLIPAGIREHNTRLTRGSDQPGGSIAPRQADNP